jgi:hypothetical protein
MSVDECPPEFANDDKDWHVLSGRNRSGPYRFSDLVGAVDRQIVKSSDLVWHPRWSDWRQVKSVPSLASAYASDFPDRENPAAPGPMPALVNKFELKLRPTSDRQARFENIVLDERIVYVVNIILIGLTILALGGLSVLIFGNNRYGVAYVVIEFTTLLLICIGIARQAKIRGFSAFRFCALSALSALLLVVMNLDALPDALDAWQGRRLLAPVRTSEQIQRVALKSPANKFVQLVVASHDAAQQTLAATAQLTRDLEPRGLTFDAVRAASNRDQLTENARELRAAEARAALALPHYVAILESERAGIVQAGRKIYADDPHHLLPGFLDALGKREDNLRERMGHTFKAIAAYYSAMGDAAEFVAQHWDQYRTTRVSKVSFTAADQGTNAQYGKLMTNVHAAQAAMVALERDNRKFNSDLKVLWTEVAKAR